MSVHDLLFLLHLTCGIVCGQTGYGVQSIWRRREREICLPYAPKEIVQTWALSSPTWPSGKAEHPLRRSLPFELMCVSDHTATLTTTLDQSEDSTKVTFTLSGVPLGMEDEIKRNLEGY